MKIHAGRFKNHSIKRVKLESTKETSSMVREAVFNMVNPLEAKVLDLFAGSGSYGLTAFSLGATKVVFVDNNSKAIKTILDNINKLNIANYVEVNNVDYKQYFKKNNDKFNLIFLDPPYNFKDYESLVNVLIDKLEDNGKIVLELEFKTIIDLEKINLDVIKNKKYGIKRIIVFNKPLSLVNM